MYDEISKQYDSFFSKKDEYVKDVNGILDIYGKLPKRPVFLDYGCGTGGHIEYLLEKVDCKIVCFDISKEMLKFTKKKLSKYEDNLIFIEQFEDLKNYTYDCIFSLFYVVNHFQSLDDWEDFTSLYECLNDNGKFIYDYWNYDMAIIDPPVSYEREESFSKIPHIKKCTASLDYENIIMDYEIYDLKKENLILKTRLNMKLWKEDFMKKYFIDKDIDIDIDILGKNFNDQDIEKSYHKIIVVNK